MPDQTPPKTSSSNDPSETASGDSVDGLNRGDIRRGDIREELPAHRSSIPDSGDSAGRSSMVSRRRRRYIFGAVVVLVCLWAVFAGLRIRSAYNSAQHAKSLLEEFRADSGGGLSGMDMLTDSPDMSKPRQAQAKFTTARDELSSPILRPLKAVPVLGRQLDVVRTLSSSSVTLLSSLITTFDEVNRTLDEVSTLPAEDRVAARLATAEKLQTSLEDLESNLPRLETGTTEGLVGPVRGAQEAFVRNRTEVLSALSRSITAIKGTRAFLAGPNTYVLLAANNAEMRAGSGMFLQAGPLTITDGRFTMGDLDPTEYMKLETPVEGFDPELQHMWSSAGPGAEWRNINLTARFDVSGRIAADMWQASGNPSAQGAMAIDIKAIQHLLKAVGSVQITETNGQPLELNADNVVEYLLINQYRDLTATGDPVEQADRRSHLGDVARAIFESFNSGELGIEKLIDALVTSGRGRHLLAWSSDPVQQAAWGELGLSGELHQDSMLFSMMNRGANKLDQFIETSVDLDVSTTKSMHTVNLEISMRNTTPNGLPEYMIGGMEGPGLDAGEYGGFLALTVPGGAGNPTVSGGELAATAMDGETRVLVVDVKIPRGQTVNIGIGFDLPDTWTQIEVQPSARIPPVTWRYLHDEWTDERPHTVALNG